MDRYIVSFFRGSSGRFISNILWLLITGQKHEIELTAFNSAHVTAPWRKNWVNEGLDTKEHDLDIWNTFQYTMDPVILPTHVYPNFSSIDDNLTGFKTIIITYSLKELHVVCGNSVYKNGFDLFPEDDAKKSYTYTRLVSHYETLTGGRMPDPAHIPIDVLKKMYLKEFKTSYNDAINEFVDASVPPGMEEGVLLLPYKDILTGKALTTLSEFTNRPIPPYVKDEYTKYIRRQHDLIATKMKWVNLDDSYRYI